MPIATRLSEVNDARSPQQGFTLTELAIVLLILGLLLSGFIVPLSTRIDQKNYNDTKQQIEEIRTALMGFAVANGRLPRPATSIANGDENSSSCADDTACTGFVPWATLGVKRTDAWNKMLRYSVSPSYANGSFALATVATKKVISRDTAGNAFYLIGSASACSSSNPCAPAVLYSAGKNNWGIGEDGTALADNSSTNADEDSNAASDKVFYSRDQSTVATGGEFDDIVLWIAPYVLMDRMISAGKLP